jgi:hypothetical protein
MADMGNNHQRAWQHSIKSIKDEKKRRKKERMKKKKKRKSELVMYIIFIYVACVTIRKNLVRCRLDSFAPQQQQQQQQQHQAKRKIPDSFFCFCFFVPLKRKEVNIKRLVFLHPLKDIYTRYDRIYNG